MKLMVTFRASKCLHNIYNFVNCSFGKHKWKCRSINLLLRSICWQVCCAELPFLTRLNDFGFEEEFSVQRSDPTEPVPVQGHPFPSGFKDVFFLCCSSFSLLFHAICQRSLTWWLWTQLRRNLSEAPSWAKANESILYSLNNLLYIQLFLFIFYKTNS